MDMRRRDLLKATGAGLAVAGVSAPAIAQSQPAIQWRLASSFPKSTDILFGASEMIARRVSEATDGKFQIRPFASGEIVPPLQVLDAVANGTIQCGHTCGYYYVGKDPTFAFDTAIPFGPNARQQNAWFQYGGGREIMREFFKGHNIVQFPAGNTGVQMGGWFRREIKALEDLQGLKMRIAGIAGQVMAKMGVTPVQIAGADVYPSLEKGTIDATEFVGPYDDEKLGFVQVAKFYYSPGWWEGGPQVSLYINAGQWEGLPKSYQAILECACAEANAAMLARYDAENTRALKILVGKGAQLRTFPREMMEAGHKHAYELYDEIASKNPAFKKVYDSWRPFLEDTQLWFRVAELPYDNLMQSSAVRRRG